MKHRLKEMEEEAAALREMQAKVAKEMQALVTNALSILDGFLMLETLTSSISSYVYVYSCTIRKYHISGALVDNVPCK
ncbi:polyadenylate-binding protein 2 [Panicum miliaceum]|uniref:Polyadenylate-binding protein 2 n=1 Tax=Panicum miliaceum TaxID=4540 RepID=A0A3L6PBV6_PANMI|nr:polyadenylate-binding protein 2 [Panicum miliaceum]